MARKLPLGFALAACVLCALCARPGLADEEADECVAQATAKAAELSNAAEAVANAVAATLTRTINCETGDLEGSDTTLSFALAVAISEVNNLTGECPAEADAQAGVAEFVSNEVQKGLNEVESDKADTKVFDASARALGESVKDTVNESDADEGTADEIARQILDAAKEILTALTCGGSNVTPGTGLCTFTNGRFVGDCSDDPKEKQGSGTRAQSAPAQDGNCRFLNGRLLCAGG